MIASLSAEIDCRFRAADWPEVFQAGFAHRSLVPADRDAAKAKVDEKK
jgi:hypothetical protein